MVTSRSLRLSTTAWSTPSAVRTTAGSAQSPTSLNASRSVLTAGVERDSRSSTRARSALSSSLARSLSMCNLLDSYRRILRANEVNFLPAGDVVMSAEIAADAPQAPCTGAAGKATCGGKIYECQAGQQYVCHEGRKQYLVNCVVERN